MNFLTSGRWAKLNSVQTRCIVKGEAQKSTLFWRFSGGFCFSQDRLFSRNSTRKPLNLIKSPIFTNAPYKTVCLYNAPSMHTLEKQHPIWLSLRKDANLMDRKAPMLSGRLPVSLFFSTLMCMKLRLRSIPWVRLPLDEVHASNSLPSSPSFGPPPPGTRSLWRGKFNIPATRNGVTNWEKFWWVIRHSKWST